MIGVYAVVNKITQQRYIGQSMNISKRFVEHKGMLKNGNHSNIYLQQAWDLYGSNNFDFVILEECTPDILLEREDFWINYYGGINSDGVYNLLISHECGGHNIETRCRVSATLRGFYANNTHHSKGAKLSEQTRLHMSKSRTGHKHSPETKLKISLSQKGRHISDEQKQRLSEIAKQRKLSDDTKRKISLSLKGRVITETTREKLRKSQLGKVIKPETRKILSDKNTLFGVAQIDIDTGMIIRKYNSVISAAEFLIANNISKATLKNCRNSIYHVCLGKRPHAYGYVWKYIERESEASECDGKL